MPVNLMVVAAAGMAQQGGLVAGMIVLFFA
jgi:hypothetical protein